MSKMLVNSKRRQQWIFAGSPLTDASLQTTLASFPDTIKSINVSSCKQLTSVSIMHLMHSNVLELQANHVPKFANFISMVESPVVMSPIQKLHLDGCPITDEDLVWLSRRLAKLQFLSLRWCEKLSARGIINLLQSLPCLTTIDVTDLGFEEAVSKGARQGLQVIATKWYDDNVLSEKCKEKSENT